MGYPIYLVLNTFNYYIYIYICVNLLGLPVLVIGLFGKTYSSLANQN